MVARTFARRSSTMVSALREHIQVVEFEIPTGGYVVCCACTQHRRCCAAFRGKASTGSICARCPVLSAVVCQPLRLRYALYEDLDIAEGVARSSPWSMTGRWADEVRGQRVTELQRAANRRAASPLRC